MKAIARIPFEYAGKQLDRGEIFETKNAPNDNRLFGLRYMIPFDVVHHERKACPNCGRAFMSEDTLIGHKKKVDCFAPTQEISKVETAELLGVDPERVRVES